MANRDTWTPKTGLGVFWQFQSKERIWSEEVPGFRVVGYWPDARIPNLDSLSSFTDVWPSGAIETKLWTMHDVDDEDSVRHVTINVRIKRWPSVDGWAEAMQGSLRYLTDRGAAVAWCEGEFGILMYDSSKTFAGCYAVYTPTTGLICLGGLNDRLRHLDEDLAIAAQIRSVLAPRGPRGMGRGVPRGTGT